MAVTDVNSGDLIDKASHLVNEAGQSIAATIFKEAAKIFNDEFANIILVLIACFWVYNKIGRGWNKEDFYKAGTWIIMFVCLKAIFASPNNYQGFLYLVNYPVTWFYTIISKLQTLSTSNNLLEQSITFVKGIWDNISFDDIPNALLLTLLGLITLLVIWLYILFLAIFIIIINLACAIILAVCPIMLPCLIIPNFRGYFFSWLKLYTSTAIQPAFATIIAGFMTSMIVNQTKNIITQQQAENFWNNPANVSTATTQIFLIIILCLIAITLLSKIPQWTQQLIGSGDGEHKTGIAGAIAGAGAMMKQGYKGYTQARSDMNYRTGGQNSIGRSLASGALSAMGMSGHAQKIAGQTSGDRGKYQDKMLQSTIQNGSFTAMPTPHVESSNANKK